MSITNQVVQQELKACDREINLVGVIGPCTSRPTGKFDRQDNPVKEKCDPYWVLSYTIGDSSCVYHHHEVSQFLADKMAAAMREGRYVYRGFRLQER